MVDKVVLGKNAYDLPRKTLKVAENIEYLTVIEKKYEKGEATATECIIAEYDFLVELMGAEVMAEVLETEDIQKADISDISICVMNIIRAYNKRVEAARFQNAVEQMNAPEVKKVLDLAERASRLPSKA